MNKILWQLSINIDQSFSQPIFFFHVKKNNRTLLATTFCLISMLFMYKEINKWHVSIILSAACVHIHRFPHEIAHPAPFILIIHNFPIGMTCSLRCGLVVRIPGFHPGGPGSIPGTGTHFCSQVCFRLHFNRSVLWF